MARLGRRPDAAALEEMELLGDMAEFADRIGAAQDAARIRRRIAELSRLVS